MEYRLYRYITFPAMIFTVLMGICLLVIQKHWLHFGWIHVKLFFILFGLIGYTFYIDRVRKSLRKEIYLTSRQCRIRNEYPTLFLIAIVLLAVLNLLKCSSFDFYFSAAKIGILSSIQQQHLVLRTFFFDCGHIHFRFGHFSSHFKICWSIEILSLILNNIIFEFSR